MNKTKNDCFVSYHVRYDKTTEQKIKRLEKSIFNAMLKDESFSRDIITNSRYASVNKLKCKKLLKLLILNLIRANNNHTELIISLDNNHLSNNHVSAKIYSGIINRLAYMNVITIHKGYLKDKYHKRTRISITERFKDLLIKLMIGYTETVKARYIETTEYSENEKIKIKITFEDIQQKKRYAKFLTLEQAQPIFEKLLKDDKTIFTLTLNNRGLIEKII